MTKILRENPAIMVDQMKPWFRQKGRDISLGDDYYVFGKWYARDTIISMYQAIPGLVAFWPMVSDRFTGNIYDLSGQGHTGAYTGNPTFGIENDVINYANFDGTGDRFVVTDASNLQLTGTEAQIESAFKGWTIGTWVQNTDISYYPFIFGKILYVPAVSLDMAWYFAFAGGVTYNYYCSMTSDGSTQQILYSSKTISSNGEWHFVVFRFNPSTELKIWVDTTTDTQTVGVPASCWPSAGTNVTLGDDQNANTAFTGKMALSFMSMLYLSDDLIESLYNNSRHAFGV